MGRVSFIRMPRDVGTKAKFKGENIVTSTAKRALLSPSNVLDIWVTYDQKRCFCSVRNRNTDPEPAPREDAIYCGEIYDRTITQGELEYQIMSCLDKYLHPWKYYKIKTFLHDPENVNYIHEVPHELINHRRWKPFVRMLPGDRIDVILRIMNAEAKAIKLFEKYPDRTELRVEADGLKFTIRGHGYYERVNR